MVNGTVIYCKFKEKIMNKILMMTIIVLLGFAGTVQSQTQTGAKILVVYFTQPVNERNGVDALTSASRQTLNSKLVGNVELAANWIARKTGGTLFQIKTVEDYPTVYEDLLDVAVREKDNNIHPRLATHISNFASYNTVFIGYPIWMYTIPMALYSFLDEYNFAGKTIIPFCVHGGSGFADSIDILKRLEPRAKMLDGFAVSRNNVARSERDVTAWLRKIDITK
jgi:flavodoxin